MSRYRDAVAAYIRGHDRALPVERLRAGSADPREDDREIEWSPVPASASFGVGVATTLRFHSGPGTRRSLEAADED